MLNVPLEEVLQRVKDLARQLRELENTVADLKAQQILSEVPNQIERQSHDGEPIA